MLDDVGWCWMMVDDVGWCWMVDQHNWWSRYPCPSWHHHDHHDHWWSCWCHTTCIDCLSSCWSLRSIGKICAIHEPKMSIFTCLTLSMKHYWFILSLVYNSSNMILALLLYLEMYCARMPDMYLHIPHVQRCFSALHGESVWYIWSILASARWRNPWAQRYGASHKLRRLGWTSPAWDLKLWKVKICDLSVKCKCGMAV